MLSVKTVEARKHFAEYINKVAYGKEKVILNRNGKDVAAIVPLELLVLLEKIETHMDIKEAETALQQFKKDRKAVTINELEQQIHD